MGDALQFTFKSIRVEYLTVTINVLGGLLLRAYVNWTLHNRLLRSISYSPVWRWLCKTCPGDSPDFVKSIKKQQSERSRFPKRDLDIHVYGPRDPEPFISVPFTDQSYLGLNYPLQRLCKSRKFYSFLLKFLNPVRLHGM